MDKFTVCSDKIFATYEISEGGSMSQIESLVGVGDLKIYLFSGDWDDVIPFSDTLKNIKRLGLNQIGLSEPWKNGE